MTNKKLYLGIKRGYCVPVWFIPKIVQWITGQIVPGNFLQAVLANDLQKAVGHADDISLECLSGIIKFLYNDAPGACWGSPDKVKSWLEMDADAHDRIAHDWAYANPEFVGPQPEEFEVIDAGTPDLMAYIMEVKGKHERITNAFREILESVEDELPTEVINAIREEHGMPPEVPFAEILTERVANAVT